MDRFQRDRGQCPAPSQNEGAVLGHHHKYQGQRSELAKNTFALRSTGLWPSMSIRGVYSLPEAHRTGGLSMHSNRCLALGSCPLYFTYIFPKLE